MVSLCLSWMDTLSGIMLLFPAVLYGLAGGLYFHMVMIKYLKAQAFSDFLDRLRSLDMRFPSFSDVLKFVRDHPSLVTFLWQAPAPQVFIAVLRTIVPSFHGPFSSVCLDYTYRSLSYYALTHVKWRMLVFFQEEDYRRIWLLPLQYSFNSSAMVLMKNHFGMVEIIVPLRRVN